MYIYIEYIVWAWPPFPRLQSSPEWHCIHLGNRGFCWLNRLICHDCLPGMGHTQYVITRNKWLKIPSLLGLQHLQPYFWGLYSHLQFGWIANNSFTNPGRGFFLSLGCSNARMGFLEKARMTRLTVFRFGKSTVINQALHLQPIIWRGSIPTSSS